MAEMTRILSAIEYGDSETIESLFSLVYDHLRNLAAYHMSMEKAAHTLQPTALVNETFLKLVSNNEGTKKFKDRRHFFIVASEAMRRILIDYARTKGRVKRGGTLQRLPLEDVASTLADPNELLDVNELLEKFAEVHPRRAELVRYRLFAGCTIPECGELLGISASTAEDDWMFARAWLGRELLKSKDTVDSSGD